ncbi:putative glutathione S-transferase [Aspergillus novofumigatus IBT 16806]|uniref:Putative glutathione S-transferase n=1 Tax=Aspergillus novofumigatus (strain IBT 16806) TaxID=1392255 RepID=A0A2I1C445_ASPN1|nr:putative glutathione S-transferase [Aspergillus novofumigatus IBT 16806]PKX92373.1 putative glutathione S-transferase [Aspergillus novofumigatus IBT 16806]
MNVFHEQIGHIALYTSPRTKEGATIAMLIELIGQPRCIHLVHSIKEIKHDDASAYTSLPVLFDVTREGKKTSASGLANISRYLLTKYDAEHHFSYKQGSKEAEEVDNWIAFLSKTIHGNNPEETFTRKALRLYLYLEEHLQKARSPYLVGKKCTLADLVIFPYVAGASQANLDLERFPELTTWHDRLARNPHVAKGMKDVYLEA